MKKFFNTDNPFFSFFGKLADAVVLHFLWLLCCLPVFTIGPATIALYYVLMKEIRNEGKQYYRMYFRAFKENFRQGILLGIIFVVVAAILVFTTFLYRNLYQEFGIAFMDGMSYITIGLLVVWIMLFTYAFALFARFNNTVPKTLLNALLLMIRYIGWTFVMAVLFVTFYLLIIFLSRYLFILIIPGYGFIALVNSYILHRILEPFAEKALKEEEAQEAAEESQELPE